MNLKSFLDSPQNRTGLSIWIGTAITAFFQQFIAHQSLSTVDLLGLILGFLKIVEPETTVTLAQLQKSLIDVKSLISAPRADAIAGVISDVNEIAQAINK
ncbi:MAG: hypothetical protein KGJ73_11395 [Rhodospirillales bacterium]|nr:hypothetical protein [Rhodospirillales bacterium]